MAELHDVTDTTFDAEVLASELPILVDFWGDDCPACRRISPILSELADDYAGRVRIVKVHAAENASVAARFGIRAMPTVLAFTGGEVRGQLVGARPKSDFEDLISNAQ